MLGKFLYTIILVLVICAPKTSYPQSKRVSNWYFGGFASLNFSTGFTAPLYNSSMNQREGVSSISDENGNLLFYTDGKTVYNKNHMPMPNGENLTGHESSTQSAHIVKSPRTDKLYYLFTNEGVESDQNGFRYNIIDMTRDNNLGDIQPNRKNSLIYSEYTEKITSIISKDESSVWVITHLDQSNQYYVYEIESGFNIVPKVYNGIFVPTERNDKIGYMKAFAGGTKIANAYYNSGIIEILDFDPNTGIISNPDTLSIFPGVYGLEFSPNGKYLYVSTVTFPSYLLQIDLDTKDIKVIAQRIKEGEHFGALQVGIDGKIYVSDDYKNGISVINKPNNFFQGCEFVYEQIKFNSSYCQLGLPNNTQTLYYKYGIDDDITVCEGDPIRLDCWTDTDMTDKTSKYLWFNPDGAVISSKKSHVIWNPDVTDSGQYKVKIDNSTGIYELTVNVTVERKSEATANFKDNIIICNNSFYDLTLDLEESASEYDIIWSTGETTPSIRVNKSGIYTVKVNDKTGCFFKEFSTNIEFSQLSGETATTIVDYLNLCSNNPKAKIEIDIAPHVEYIYKWFDSNLNLISSEKSVIVFSDDIYFFEVIDSKTGCMITGKREIEFSKNGEFVLNLGPDVKICNTEYQTNLLVSDTIDKVYLWSTGETTQNIVITQSGEYTVTVTDTSSGCSKQEDIIVQLNEDIISVSPQQIVDRIYTTDSKIFNFSYQSNTDINIYLKRGVDFILDLQGSVALVNNNYGRYKDTIVFESTRCGVIKEIPIQIDNILKVKIDIPSDTVFIGDDVCLNIDVSFNENLSFIPSFIYDKNVFYLKDVYWSSSDIILCGTVLLSNKEFTEVIIDETNLEFEFIEISYNAGRLYIREICVQNIRQIEQAVPLNLNVYPNPSNRPFSIEYSGPANKIIKIYNMFGKLEFRKNLINETGIFKLDFMSTGNYIVILESGDNKIKKQITYIK